MSDYDDANMANFKESEPVNSSMSYSEEKADFYEIIDSAGSYVHIYKNSGIWLGSVERTIALELVRKLNPKSEPVVSQDQEPGLRGRN